MIFQNFGSKAALFAAVVDRVAGEVRTELERMARRPGSAAELLGHALRPARPGDTMPPARARARGARA